MSPSLQAKVLRVLESGEIERVGGAETIRVDVRIISATNQDLEKRIEMVNFVRIFITVLMFFQSQYPTKR